MIAINYETVILRTISGLLQIHNRNSLTLALDQWSVQDSRSESHKSVGLL